jgi:DNA-binding LytR/AlgR family response regulator
MNYKCLIVDDEAPARALLEEFVSRIPYLTSVGSFKNPLEAVALIQNKEVDILFLDIMMPDIKGTSFVQTLTHQPEVIFTTAYSEYALESYQLNVTDYLLKPFSFERFNQAVNKAIGNLAHQSPVTQNQTLVIHSDHKIFRLNTSDVLYIEGLKEYVSYYTLEGKRIISLQSLKSIEASLGTAGFMRTHRSYIVNLEHVDYMEGSSLLIKEKRIPIGRMYLDEVKRKMTNLPD